MIRSDKPTRNLVIFFAATWIWTWAWYAPIVAGQHSPYGMPWMPLLIVGGMGPSVVGVSMALLTYNREERREFWRRCFSFRRIGLPWWLFIFLIFPLILGLSVAVDLATGGAPPGMEQINSLLNNPLMIPLSVLISFLSGPWSEEFGWRGYALDPLINRLGAVWGSVVLGAAWAVWHLPLYFMADTWHAQMGFKPAGFWTFIVFEIGLSLLMTWVYLNTNRSILSAMLLHFTANFSAQLIAPSSDRVEGFRTGLVLVVGLLGCLAFLRSSLPHPVSPSGLHGKTG